MGSKQLRSVIPEFTEEKSTSFKRQEDGTFKMVTSVNKRNLRTNQIVSEEEISSESYSLTTSEDYDREMKVQDHLGNDVSIRFKMIESEENIEEGS